MYKVDNSIEIAPESVEISEAETGIEIKPEPPKLDPVTNLYPFLINSWSGECVEGVPHGFGRCEFKSGTVYTGNMSYGLMHGKGMVGYRFPRMVRTVVQVIQPRQVKFDSVMGSTIRAIFSKIHWKVMVT